MWKILDLEMLEEYMRNPEIPAKKMLTLLILEEIWLIQESRQLVTPTP